jgi:hypothetical protein
VVADGGVHGRDDKDGTQVSEGCEQRGAAGSGDVVARPVAQDLFDIHWGFGSGRVI